MPQVATPRPGLSPWVSCHIVPQTTPKKEEINKPFEKIEPKIVNFEEDGVVPTLEIATRE